jgi:hypothetical protein
MAWTRLPLLLVLLLLAGCPEGFSRKPTADSLLSDYAAAIRWNEFDKAVDFLDPALREAQPLTDLERERFKQVQVTGYEVKDRDTAADGGVTQVVEIRLVNRNTQVERTLIDHQQWRFDPLAKRLWLTSGLPDLSQR